MLEQQELFLAEAFSLRSYVVNLHHIAILLDYGTIHVLHKQFLKRQEGGCDIDIFFF